MDNKKIAEVFEEIANILEISDENFFKVNAYKKASLTVMNLAQDLRQMVEETPQDIDKIPGIGKALKDKIIELVETGKCREHERIKEGFPKGLLEMLKLRGLGPKKIKLFYLNLGITTMDQLKKAAEEHKLSALPGMGEKSEADILKSMKEFSMFSTDRHLVNEALQEAQRYIEYLNKLKEIEKIQYAGSLRRGKETIGDIDILVTAKDHPKVMEHFVKYGEVLNVIAEGDTKSSVILQSGIQVDLRVVAAESFGAALHYFTGSREHNIKIRDLAKRKGMKINEYGVFKGEKMIGGETEEEIFNAVGLPFVPPELRKNDGEFEYLLKNKKLPKLIELSDIKGDFHCHSNYSDGKNTIEEMAKACMERGYEYFAMSDHSSVMGVTGGMGTSDIKKQWKEIDKLNEKLKGKIKILKSCEVDILKDGSLDFSDEVLKELDLCVISAHMHQNLPAEDQTKRIIAAIENPYSKILGHPTGRLLNKRKEMEFDMKKVIAACVENDVYLEINSNPMRLDLTDKYIRIAKEKGAKFSINTDSHSVDHLEFMKFGVAMARRGWLEKKDVLNCKSLKEV